MKRKFTFLTAALALLAFLAIPMGMMGQTRDVETFTFSELGYGNAEDVTTVVGDDVTLTFDAGTNTSNSPKYYNTGAGVRMYADNTLEVALNDQTGDTRITAIDFTFSGSSYTGGLQNWTGSETSHTFTATGTARIQVITVTFSEGGVAPTTYTVTYYANVTATAPVVDTYIEGADVTLRDANTFTNDGYTFSEWNTQADGDGDAYDAGDVIEDIQDNIELYAIWTENPVSDEQWVLTSLNDLTANDVFVIVSTKGSANYAMSNDKGASAAPTAVSVTVADNQVTSTVASTIQWTGINGNATDGYTIYSNADNTKYLYCIGQNNGVRVGSGNDNTFIIKDNYIYNNGQGRYIGVFNDADWRCYTTIHANIAGQTFAFYKKVTGGVVPPSITAANVDIEYNATSGSITYTINNEVDGGTVTASTTADWITLGNNFDSPIAFTCTANEAGTARTATVTLTYTYNRETVTKDVTVTQAAAPVVYNTMQAIFDKATEVGNTATSVNIALQNWVVSGVSTNGKNVFVTDGTKGFVIFNTDGNMGFAVGNVLSGTVSCKVQLYHGFAEITELNSSTEGISIATGGTVTEANIAMAELAGVNTSALVSYNNLTCSVTTSGNNTFYNLSDGTTTIQVYNSLYAFDALIDGKTYNITGIYQQYNNTKEILPRSADDIVEVVSAEPSITVNPDLVEVNADEHDGTLDLTYENLEISDMTDFAIQYYDAESEEAETPDWIEVTIAEQDPSIGEGYVVSYYMIENESEARSAYFKVYALDDEAELVYSNLVTVNQAAYVAPPTPGNWVLTNLTDLTEDDVFVIVGTYEDLEHDSYAMSNDKGTQDPPVAVAVTVVDGTLSGEPAANIQWTLGITDDGYIFYPNGTTETWLYCTNTNNGVRVGTNATNDIFTMSDGYMKNTATSRYVGIYNTQDWRCYTNTTGNIANQSFAFYKRTVEPETYTLEIEGYGTSTGGYYLIASPVNVNPANVQGEPEGMTEGNFDLYYFDQAQEAEWRNYEAAPFNLVPGKGYLYAHDIDVELTLTGAPYQGDGEIELAYTVGGDFPGWNLVGNPFGQDAEISNEYYVMNDEGSELIAGETYLVAPMQGVFVVAEGEGESVIFEPVTAPTPEPEKLVMNVRSNRGNVIDRAMIRFGEGRQLPKFMFNDDNTKLYIAEGNEEFAVVRSINENTTPVSFHAAENGTYTLSINAENVEMEYLHLIDNFTGSDVDLLANPSYTFAARTTDNANRFKLVYATCDDVNENNVEPFAYFNGSEWVINNEGEATLQVVDVTGRMVSSETVNGNVNVSLDQTSGIYMLRLVNGNSVKTQKVVVR